MENKDLCGRHLYHLYECMNRYQLEVQMTLMREDMTLMVQKKKKSLESFIIQLFALLLTIVGGRRLAKVVANRFSESHEFIHLHLRPHVDWVDGKMGLCRNGNFAGQSGHPSRPALIGTGMR